jgi:CRISPR system Cascade subunit CasA
LTPYSLVSAGEPWNPKKGSPDGLPYRDWPQLVTGSAKRKPATVVTYFAQSRRREVVPMARLLAFGYAMDNMKPLRWCRAETPLITVAPSEADAFAVGVEALVAASEEVRRELSSQLKAAWSDRPKDLDVFDRVNPAFWSATEPEFFEAVQAAKRCIEADDTVGGDAAKEAWLTATHRAALSLFDSFVDASAALAPPDLRRAVAARRNLDLFTSPRSRKLRKALSLPVDEPEESMPKRGRSAGRKEKTT